MSARVSASAVAVRAMRGTLGIALVQHREAQVVFAEVVAPLAHAMRLVDGEEREQAALVQRVELGQHARRGNALGRGVEQHQPPAHHLALDPRGVGAVERRVQERGVHAGLLERSDLVLHQCDQRADDHRDALPGAMANDRRHLVAQALAAAGGHEHQRVAARDRVLDDRVLQAAEFGVAEHVAQDAPSGVGRRRSARAGAVTAFMANGHRTRASIAGAPSGECPQRGRCPSWRRRGVLYRGDARRHFG